MSDLKDTDGLRRRGVATINGKAIEINELSVGQILSLLQGDEATNEAFLDRAERFLAMACPSLSIDALKEYTPSQIDLLRAKFMEVNASFFDLARTVGLGDVMQAAVGRIKSAIMTDFSKAFSALSKQGTVESGNME